MHSLIGIFRAAVWADGGVHRFGQSGVFVEFQFIADALETHKVLLLKTPFVVIFSSSSAPKSPACCLTVAIDAAISSKPSP